MTIRDHITEELGCYLLPMLKWVTLLHKYKLCKICPTAVSAVTTNITAADQQVGNTHKYAADTYIKSELFGAL